MMRFQVEGEFEAEDIDQAIALLAAHFAALSALGLDAPTILDPGFMRVQPVREEAR